MSAFKFATLLVDDETEHLEMWRSIVADLGFEPICVASPGEALKIIEKEHHRLVLVISDFRMSEMNGLELRRSMLPRYQDIPFVILTAYLTKAQALEGIDVKISAFLEKPQTLESIRPVVERLTTDRMVAIRDDLEMKKGFWQDSQDMLKDLEADILSLDSELNKTEILANIMRILHTLKGTASCLDLDAVRGFGHAFEDFVSPFRSGHFVVVRSIVSVMLQGYDILNKLVDKVTDYSLLAEPWNHLKKIFDVDWERVRLEAAGDGKLDDVKGGKAVEGSSDATEKEEEIRVSTQILDEFMELSGELTVNRSFVVKHVQLLEQKYGQSKEIELLASSIGEMQKISSIMQQRIEEVRKVPLKTILRQLNRVVRDASRASGKQVKLVLKGENIRVDTSIGNVLSNSLVHMVRNSVDHGIESSEVRKKSGKSTEGLLIIQCADQGENIVIEIIDDGGGINVDKVKAKAIERLGFTQSELDSFNKNRILSMIFESGFSTADKVTEISGRGVGMDMVKTSVLRLGGRIDIFSDLGRGTRFVLTLPKPRSALIMWGLFVGVGTETFCISREEILKVISLDANEREKSLRNVDNKEFYVLEGELVPILELREWFHLEKGNQWLVDQEDKLVLLRIENGCFVVRVDAFLDSEEIVLKPLSSTQGLRGEFLGATFFGEQVALVLSAEGLSKSSDVSSRRVEEVDLVDEINMIGDRDSEEFLLIRDVNREQRVIALGVVERLYEIRLNQIEMVGKEQVVRLRGETISVLNPARDLQEGWDQADYYSLILIRGWDKRLGLLVREICDIVTSQGPTNEEVTDPGILGSVLVGKETIAVWDLDGFMNSCGVGKIAS